MNEDYAYGYEWFPSASESPILVRIGMDRKSTSEKHVRYRCRIPDCEELIYPDRHIYVDHNLGRYEFAPVHDHNIDLNIHHKQSPYNQICHYVLASTHYTAKIRNFRQILRDAGLKGFGDSGGAQYKLDRIDHHYYYNVIRGYNDGFDIGVAYDIAPLLLDDDTYCDNINDTYLREASIIQAEVNAFFAEHARDDLVLMNVSHGGNISQMRRWNDNVQHPRFNCFAVTSHGSRNQFAGGMLKALILITEYGIRNWIHFFGIGSMTMIPLMAWLGKTMRITSDSTTHLNSAKRGEYFYAKDGVYGNIYVGRKSRHKWADMGQDDIKNRLPCDCPICTEIKTFSALSQLNKTLCKLLIMHNIYCLKQVQNAWNVLAQASTPDQYRNILREKFKQGKIVRQFDFVCHALAHGVDSAIHEYPELAPPNTTETFEQTAYDGQKKIFIPADCSTNYEILSLSMIPTCCPKFEPHARQFNISMLNQLWPLRHCK